MQAKNWGCLWQPVKSNRSQKRHLLEDGIDRVLMQCSPCQQICQKPLLLSCLSTKKSCCGKIKRDSSPSAPSNPPWKHNVWPHSSQVSQHQQLRRLCFSNLKPLVPKDVQSNGHHFCSNLELKETELSWLRSSKITQQTQPWACKVNDVNSPWSISSWTIGMTWADALQRHRLRDKAVLERQSFNSKFYQLN